MINYNIIGLDDQCFLLRIGIKSIMGVFESLQGNIIFLLTKTAPGKLVPGAVLIDYLVFALIFL